MSNFTRGNSRGHKSSHKDFQHEMSRSTTSGAHSHERRGIIFEITQGYLTESHSGFKKEFPTCYVVGDENYSLLKIYLKKLFIPPLIVGDHLDLDSNKEKFYLVKRISIDQIPLGTEYTLEETLTNLVKEQEQKFVKFFNEARPITVKLHQLTLIPGIGQKRMWTILDARKVKLFDSFKDFEIRAGVDPVPMLVKRLQQELTGNERYYLFSHPLTKTSHVSEANE